MKKLACVVGIIASLWATYGLVMYVVLLHTLGISQSYYPFLPVLSLSYVLLFVRAWKDKLPDIVKWTGVAVSVGGIYLAMRSAHILLLVFMISLLFASSGCLMFVEASEDSRMFPRWGKRVLVSCYSVLLIVLVRTFFLSTENPFMDQAFLAQFFSQQTRDLSATMAPAPRAQHRRQTQTGDSAAIQAPIEENENELNFRWILPPDYYFGRDFYEGRTWVQEKKDGPWTLFDSDGNVIKKDFMAKNIWQDRSSSTRFQALEKDSETRRDMCILRSLRAPIPLMTVHVSRSGLCMRHAQD